MTRKTKRELQLTDEPRYVVKIGGLGLKKDGEEGGLKVNA